MKSKIIFFILLLNITCSFSISSFFSQSPLNLSVNFLLHAQSSATDSADVPSNEIDETKNHQFSYPLTAAFPAKVISIEDSQTIKTDDQTTYYQLLKVKSIQGPTKNQEFLIENDQSNNPLGKIYQIGEQLVLDNTGGATLDPANPDETAKAPFFITDVFRQRQILLIFIAFLILTIVIGRLEGIRAILSMIASFAVIFLFTLPQILAGHDPILISILSVMMIIPLSFYISYGWRPKTHTAIISTIIALLITVILAHFSIEFVQLTGFGSEDVMFVQAILGQSINVKGLLLAGLILATLGVLNDVTVAQSALIFQFAEMNPQLTALELYRTSMKLGRDHIASMVDTLVLTYAGASLPLLILIGYSQQLFAVTISYEIIAQEIIRTLIGSIGLVLAVPIASLIASWWAKKWPSKTSSIS